MTMTVRGLAHSGWDRLRGGRQTRILQEIREVQTGGDRAERLREHWLRQVLDHAAATTDAYRDISPGAPLTDFPVIDKNQLRDNAAAMLSSAFRGQQLPTASTSGSTGTPLVIQQDPAKRLRRSVDAIYFGSEAGYALGDRMYYLKIWSGRNQQSKLAHFARNTVPVDIIHFGDEEVERLLNDINAARGRVTIAGYSSALERIARYLWQQPSTNTARLSSIIAQSEALAPESRERLAQHFGVTPVGRYGMEEVGIIAQQTPRSDDYVINRAGAHVEILDLHSDRPAGPGELGRIVVTDLHNMAMPIIRYDTGAGSTLVVALRFASSMSMRSQRSAPVSANRSSAGIRRDH